MWRDEILLAGLAGGTAGCVAKTVVAPLDRIKLLFQTANPEFKKYTGSVKDMVKALGPIYKTSGVAGLFQGHSATLLRIFPYAAIKFVAYEQASMFLRPKLQYDGAHRDSDFKDGSFEKSRDLKESREFKRTTLKDFPERHFLAGAIAGCTGTILTYPLELMRVRLAYVSATPGRALRQTCVDIYAEAPAKGLRIFNFYRGCGMTLLGVVPYAGTAFLAYELLKKKVKYGETGSSLVAGALAGVCGQTASYPFEIIRRRMQVGGLTAPQSAWLDTRTVVSMVWRSEGWRGFYRGLSIGFIKVVPMTAVSFTTWQFMRRVLGIEKRGRNGSG